MFKFGETSRPTRKIRFFGPVRRIRYPDDVSKLVRLNFVSHVSPIVGTEWLIDKRGAAAENMGKLPNGWHLGSVPTGRGGFHFPCRPIEPFACCHACRDCLWLTWPMAAWHSDLPPHCTTRLPRKDQKMSRVYRSIVAACWCGLALTLGATWSTCENSPSTVAAEPTASGPNGKCREELAWVHKGFEEFSKGRFDNGGDDLYVNAHGVIRDGPPLRRQQRRLCGHRTAQLPRLYRARTYMDLYPGEGSR